jgi:superfamily I DNA/RNA helicase
MEFMLPTLDQLTPQMKNLVNFSLDQHLLVVWAPWTWKSVVAIHRYKKLKWDKKKIMVLCYNVLLNQLLQYHCDEKECRTVDSFYGHITYVNNDNQKKDWPRIWDESIDIIKNEFLKYVQEKWKFDAILIDEAQDLPIEIIQTMSILTNHISLFADPNQPLKNPSSDIGQIEYLFQNLHKEILTKNYRNTKEIYEFAANQFMSWNELANNPSLTLNAISDEHSMPIILRNITTTDHQIQEIKKIIEYKTYNTVGIFVSGTNKVDTMYHHLNQSGYTVTKYHTWAKDVNFEKTILITTYNSAKWLEFDLVILIVDDMGENTNQKLYVLSTRAKQRLYYIFAK